MLFNKNTARQVGDKKVLHKVKKQWVVLSSAILMAVAGGAIATHANANAAQVQPSVGASRQVNAPTPNANASAGANNQSNASANNQSVSVDSASGSMNLNGVSPEVQARIASLDAAPQVQGVQSANAPTSKNATSNGSNGSASSQVSYVSGDNGSAASYHAKAVSASTAVNRDSAMINSYAQSLNSRYPQQINSYNARINAKSKATVRDNKLATSYGNVAKGKNYSQEVNSSASAAGLTASDYMDSAEYNANALHANKNTLRNVNRFLGNFRNFKDQFNSDNAQPASAEASANFDVANAQLSGAKAEYSAVNSNFAANNTRYANARSASVAAEVALISASGNNDIARANFTTDNNYLTSEAKTMNMAPVQLFSEVSSAAKSMYVAHNANYASASVNGIKANSDLARAFSDVAATSAFNSVSASANSVKASVAALNGVDLNSSASAALSSASAAVVNAQERYNVASAENVLAHDFSTNANSAADALIKDLAASGNLNAFTSAMDNTLGVNAANASAFNSAMSEALSGEGFTASDMNNDFGALNSAANNYDTNLASLAANSSTASSADSDAMSMEASILAGNFSNASSAATSYDDAYSVPLASYLASSYASDASVASGKAKDASKALQHFYESNTNNSDILQALHTYKKEQRRLADDSALAKAFAVHVLNYGPKYITMMKRAHVYTNPDYAQGKSEGSFGAGTTLAVRGVGFASNGLLRYVVSADGMTGYITANQKYATPTYLPVSPDPKASNRVTVQTMAPVAEHQGPVGPRVNMIQPGTELTGTIEAEPDANFGNQAVYGGFTRIKLDDGNYITSNTGYVSVVNTPKQSNDTNTNTSNNTGNQNIPAVSFWY